MKVYLTGFLLVSFLMTSLVFAQTASEVENVGLLPTNPFYFLKNWKHGIQRFFTFNPISKAELELRITNQKAVELKKVREIMPDNEQGITKALQNYQKSHDRLRLKLEALTETSQNPNVDRLLDKLADRIVRHEKLFDEIFQKAKHDTIKAVIRNVRARIEETVGAAAEKAEPAKFASKLEKARIVLEEAILVPEPPASVPELPALDDESEPVRTYDKLDCDVYRRGLIEMSEAFRAGEITKYQFDVTHARIRRTLSACKSGKIKITE